MTIYEQIAAKIIKEQELLMGPVAWHEAGKVDGLRIIDKKIGDVSIDASFDNNSTIDSLVARYERLFGRAAREVCKEAVGAIIADLTPAQVPSNLQ